MEANMAESKPRDLKVFLDGKARTVRTWTESDAANVPMMIASGDPDLADSVFAFSKPELFDNWLDKNGLARDYAKGRSLLDRSTKRLNAAAEKRVSAVQEAAAASHAAEIARVLAEKKIEVHDTNAVIQFFSSFDPLMGPPSHSAFLYEHIDRKGAWRYLPALWSWPKFSWINFDNKCSSVLVILGWLVLWENTWYGGRGIGMFGYPGASFNIHAHPFYFNDRASSATGW
jgi:hypothetical protein